VAVKLFSLALVDSVGSERFRREGTMLTRLNHPKKHPPADENRLREVRQMLADAERAAGPLAVDGRQ
jgi:hypothetical protein